MFFIIEKAFHSVEWDFLLNVLKTMHGWAGCSASRIIWYIYRYVSFPKQRDFSLHRAVYNFYTTIPTQKSIGSSKSMKFAF